MVPPFLSKSHSNHYQVAVLGADGQYNLEKGDNVGDLGDFWKEGMMLGPGNGRVFPNTDAYQFGSIRVTGVTIYNIQRVDDTVMKFSVSGLSETQPPAVDPLTEATPLPSSTVDSTDDETPATDELPPVDGDVEVSRASADAQDAFSGATHALSWWVVVVISWTAAWFS